MIHQNSTSFDVRFRVNATTPMVQLDINIILDLQIQVIDL